MASYGILMQELQDFDKADQRYARDLRRYNNSFERNGDTAKLYGDNLFRGGLLSNENAGPRELNSKGQVTSKPGSPNLYYQPYESFTGGVQAARKGATYIGRNESALKLESRDQLTPVTYLVREAYDDGSNPTTQRIREDELEGMNAWQRQGWTGATKVTEYLDAEGNVVAPTNTGDAPRKIVQGEDGQHYLETYSLRGEPEHRDLRLSNTSRTQQDAIKAQQNLVAQLTIKANSADSKDSAKRRAKRVEKAQAELEQMEAAFKPRYYGAPSLTRAEETKLAAGPQSVSAAERDGGKTTIQRTGAGQWSPFAASNAGEGILMRALKNNL